MNTTTRYTVGDVMQVVALAFTNHWDAQVIELRVTVWIDDTGTLSAAINPSSTPGAVAMCTSWIMSPRLASFREILGQSRAILQSLSAQLV